MTITVYLKSKKVKAVLSS